MTTVYLVDDHRIFLTGVQAELEGRFDVVGSSYDVDAAVDMVADRFGHIPAGAAPKPAAVTEPDQHGERRVVLERPGSTGYLEVAYRAPAFTEADSRGLARILEKVFSNVR